MLAQQCQQQISYFEAALIFSLLTNAVAIGCVLSVRILEWTERKRAVIAPALRSLGVTR